VSAAVAISQTFFQNYYTTISSSEAKLYFALCYFATLSKDTELQLPQITLQRFTGLSHMTIAHSRNQLQQLNLIQILEGPTRNSPTKYKVELLASTVISQPSVIPKPISYLERPSLEAKATNLAFKIWKPIHEQKARARFNGVRVDAINCFDFFYDNFVPKLAPLSDQELVRFVEQGRSPIIRDFIQSMPTGWGPEYV
jgi:hypothetical protein